MIMRGPAIRQRGVTGKLVAAAFGFSVLSCFPASVSADQEVPNAAQFFSEFLTKEGEDIEACFKGMPELENPELDSSFEGPGPKPDEPQLRRLVVAIDGSGSMAGRVGGRQKMRSARSAALKFVGSIPKDVEIGVVAFGHTGNNQESGKSESCNGVEVLQQTGAGSKSDARSAIGSVEATGWTPLAAAIEKAGAMFAPSENAGEQVVYVVSDGKETCGGDPVEAARKLHESDVKAVVNIIGFDLKAKDREQLQSVAKSGGGVFAEAKNGNDLRAKLGELARKNRNTGRLVRAKNDGIGAITRNKNAVLGALTRMKNCTYGGMTREKNAFFRNRSEYKDVQDGARQLLNERHSGFRSRVDAVSTSARATLNANVTEIRSKLDKIRKGHKDSN